MASVSAVAPTGAPERTEVSVTRTVRALAGAVVIAMTAGALATAAAAQTEDLTAWCQARVDAEAAFGSGDQDAITAALEAFAAAAPAAVAADTTTVADLLAKKGEKAFASKKFVQAIERVDAYVVENCGYPVVEVSAIDYELDGVPPTVAPGITVFHLTNDAPKEEHEIVIFRVNDGVKTPAKKLLSLPEKKIQKLVQFVGATDASPSSSSASVTNLEPGRYVYGCFVPVGGKKKGAPHFTKGMFGEFEVAEA